LLKPANGNAAKANLAEFNPAGGAA
jgi:hypothetical protein